MKTEKKVFYIDIGKVTQKMKEFLKNKQKEYDERV